MTPLSELVITVLVTLLIWGLNTGHIQVGVGEMHFTSLREVTAKGPIKICRWNQIKQKCGKEIQWLRK